MKPSLQEGFFTAKVFQIIVVGGFFLLIVGMVLVYRNTTTIDNNVNIVYNYLLNMTVSG
jgi:hypothetical protein